MEKTMINMIAAVDESWGLGKNGQMPWPKNKDDLSFFRAMTEGSDVIMGRKTWESLGSTPLKNRTNLVVGTQAKGFFHYKFPTLDSSYLLKLLVKAYGGFSRDNLWVIGGASLYTQFMPVANTVYLTKLPGSYDCDVFFPETYLKKKLHLEQTIQYRSIFVEKWVDYEPLK
jgi:dihydrofolate reductase